MLFISHMIGLSVTAIITDGPLLQERSLQFFPDRISL